MPPQAEENTRKMAALGLTQDDIADFLEVSDRTMRRRLAEDPKLLAAYAKGRAEGRINAAQQLRKLMNAGDFRAISFFLARRAGWVVPQENADLTPEAMADRVHAFIASLDEDMPSRPDGANDGDADDQEFD